MKNYFNGYIVNLFNYEKVMKCRSNLNNIYKIKVKKGKKITWELHLNNNITFIKR